MYTWPTEIGSKDSPPYPHDSRLLTLENTVEFFNLVQELKLTEKKKGSGEFYESSLESHFPKLKTHLELQGVGKNNRKKRNL